MSSTGGGISSYVGGKAAAVIAAAAIAGGAVVIPAVTGGGGGAPACTQTFTTSNVGSSPYPGSSVNSAVQGGTTSTVLCFASGAYGELDIYNAGPSGSSGQLLMRPANSATVSGINFNLNGVRKVKIDGFAGSSSTDGMVVQDTGLQTNQSITFSNNRMTSNGVYIRDGRAGSGPVLVDSNEFVGFGSSPEQSRLVLYNNCPAPQNVTISNNEFGNGQADGIDLTGTCDVDITGNVIYGINQGNCGGIHCDAIQDNGGSSGVTITGNYLYDNDTGIMAYDGCGSGWVVSDNVVEAEAAAGNSINLGGCSGPTVTHNTILGSGKYINFGSKSGQQTTNITVRDNIAPGGVASNGAGTAASFTTNDYNLCVGGCTGSHSVSGSPTFAGGSTPSAYEGFCLSSGSTGKGAASDGDDMGIRC